MFIYKIRHKKTGLYSKGGYDPQWSNKGKTWNHIGHIKLHLREIMINPRIKKDLENWEIIEIALVQTENSFNQTPIDLIREMQEKDRLEKLRRGY
jgi:hypothetical protein